MNDGNAPARPNSRPMRRSAGRRAARPARRRTGPPRRAVAAGRTTIQRGRRLRLMLCRWTRNFSAAPARERPHLGPYLQRVLARPAVQRALAFEKLAPPFV